MFAELSRPVAVKELPESSLEEDELNEMLQAAATLEERQLLNKAEKQLLEALSFARKTFGDRSLFTANALLRIGSFYSRRSKFLSAKPYIEEFENLIRRRQRSGVDFWQ